MFHRWEVSVVLALSASAPLYCIYFLSLRRPSEIDAVVFVREFRAHSLIPSQANESHHWWSVLVGARGRPRRSMAAEPFAWPGYFQNKLRQIWSRILVRRAGKMFLLYVASSNILSEQAGPRRGPAKLKFHSRELSRADGDTSAHRKAQKT